MKAWSSSTSDSAGFSCAESAKTEPPSIFERLNPCLDFQNRITKGGQAVAFIGLCEQLGFHNARPVGERQKFHRLAGNLVVRALLHNQATRRDGFPDELAKPTHWAVAVPRHIGKQFQGVAPDGITEQIRLRFQRFPTRGVCKWNRNQLLAV